MAIYETKLEDVKAQRAAAERLADEAGQIAEEHLPGNLGIWDLLDREQFTYEVAEHLANGGSKNATGLAMLMVEEAGEGR